MDNKTLWTYATKWWFFLALHVSLALLSTIISYPISFASNSWNPQQYTILAFIREFFVGYFLILYFMPGGLLVWLKILGVESSEETLGVFLISYWIIVVVGTIIIQYFKYSRQQVLRWLIIAVIILMLLAFSGCVTNMFTGTLQYDIDI